VPAGVSSAEQVYGGWRRPECQARFLSTKPRKPVVPDGGTRVRGIVSLIPRRLRSHNFPKQIEVRPTNAGPCSLCRVIHAQPIP